MPTVDNWIRNLRAASTTLQQIERDLLLLQRRAPVDRYQVETAVQPLRTDSALIAWAGRQTASLDDLIDELTQTEEPTPSHDLWGQPDQKDEQEEEPERASWFG